MYFISDSDDDFVDKDILRVLKKSRKVQLQDGSNHLLPIVNKVYMDIAQEQKLKRQKMSGVNLGQPSSTISAELCKPGSSSSNNVEENIVQLGSDNVVTK